MIFFLILVDRFGRYRKEQFLFRGEVFIDGCFGNFGILGDIGDSCLVKSLLSKGILRGL